MGVTHDDRYLITLVYGWRQMCVAGVYGGLAVTWCHPPLRSLPSSRPAQLLSTASYPRLCWKNNLIFSRLSGAVLTDKPSLTSSYSRQELAWLAEYSGLVAISSCRCCCRGGVSRCVSRVGLLYMLITRRINSRQRSLPPSNKLNKGDEGEPSLLGARFIIFFRPNRSISCQLSVAALEAECSVTSFMQQAAANLHAVYSCSPN